MIQCPYVHKAKLASLPQLRFGIAVRPSDEVLVEADLTQASQQSYLHQRELAVATHMHSASGSPGQHCIPTLGNKCTATQEPHCCCSKQETACMLERTFCLVQMCAYVMMCCHENGTSLPRAPHYFVQDLSDSATPKLLCCGNRR